MTEKKTITEKTTQGKDKERSPAMQFYFRQFSGDEAVQVMDLDAVGAHILLMCAAGSASERYKIRYDKAKLARLFRNQKKEDFDRILAQLLDGAWKVSEDGQWLIQEGMLRTLRKQKHFSKTQAEKAQKRWHAGAMPERCRSHAGAYAGAMPSSSSSSSSISNKKENARADSDGQVFKNVGNPETDIPANLLSAKTAIDLWVKYSTEKLRGKGADPIALEALYMRYANRAQDLIRDIQGSVSSGWRTIRDCSDLEQQKPEPKPTAAIRGSNTWKPAWEGQPETRAVDPETKQKLDQLLRR